MSDILNRFRGWHYAKINNLPNATTLDLSDKVLGVVGGLAKKHDVDRY